MTSAEFLDRAARYLPEREFAAIGAARLSAPDAGEGAVAGESAACMGVSPLLDGYYAWDRAFRSALAKLRAARLGRPAPALPATDGTLAYDAEAQARAAVQAASPLEGELAIERARWAAIDSHLGFDVFSFEAVAAYRLRLQSLERAAALTAERGEEGYRTAYAAILGAANTIDLSGDPQ